MMRHVLAWDEFLLLQLHKSQRAALTGFMRALTHLGDGSSWALVCAVVLCLEAPASHLGATLATALVLTTAAAQALKRVCRRPRPSKGITGFSPRADNPDAFSFPSGHTAAAFSVALVAWSAPGLGPLLTGLAALIGFSRVYLGAHYPLDVVLGALLGVTCGTLAATLCGVLP